MKNLDSSDNSQDDLSQKLLFDLQSQKRGILDVIKQITIEDEKDSEIIMKAVAFIEVPTENLTDIMSHTTSVGHVLMLGVDLPPMVDNIYVYLLALQCINRIHFIEELLKVSPDIPEIQQEMSRGLSWAGILSKAYNDDSLVNAFNELGDRLDN